MRSPAILAVLLLLLMGLLAGGAAWQGSVTVDEVAHTGAGVSYLQKARHANERGASAVGQDAGCIAAGVGQGACRLLRYFLDLLCVASRRWLRIKSRSDTICFLAHLGRLGNKKGWQSAPPPFTDVNFFIFVEVESCSGQVADFPAVAAGPAPAASRPVSAVARASEWP